MTLDTIFINQCRADSALEVVKNAQNKTKSTHNTQPKTLRRHTPPPTIHVSPRVAISSAHTQNALARRHVEGLGATIRPSESASHSSIGSQDLDTQRLVESADQAPQVFFSKFSVADLRVVVVQIACARSCWLLLLRLFVEV